jgi:hypothetical protein
MQPPGKNAFMAPGEDSAQPPTPSKHGIHHWSSLSCRVDPSVWGVGARNEKIIPP